MTVLTVQRAWRIMDACGANAGGEFAVEGGGDCRKGFKGREGTERGLREKGSEGV